MSLFRFVGDASYPGADPHYLLAQKIVSIYVLVSCQFSEPSSSAFCMSLKWKEVYKLCCGYRVTGELKKLMTTNVIPQVYSSHELQERKM